MPHVKCLLLIMIATPRGLAVILYAFLGSKSIVSVGDRASVGVLAVGVPAVGREFMGAGQSPLPRSSLVASTGGATVRGREREREREEYKKRLYMLVITYFLMYHCLLGGFPF